MRSCLFDAYICILIIQDSRYYVDLDSVPPRASLVHPADGVSQEHDQSGTTSVLSRPLPIINATASGNSSDNVQTDGTTTTPAQRLYATGMTTASASLPTARSIVDGDATPVDTPTQASPPLPPTGISESEHFLPRFQQLREKRRTSLPFLSISLSEGSTGQTLYNPVVQASASVPTSDSFKDVLRGRGTHIGGHEFHRRALPPTPVDGERRNSLIMTSTTIHANQHTNLYSGITEDNLFLMPTHAKVSSAEQCTILIDEVPLSPVSPTRSGFPKSSSSFTRSTDQVILQPRPIKPLQGLTASFQNQIRETSQPSVLTLEEKQLENSASRTTKARFMRFTSAGLRKTIRQDSRRPSRHSDDDFSWTQILDTSLDGSFVLVDDTHF